MDFSHCISASVALFLATATIAVHAQERLSSPTPSADWQVRRLMAPTASQLASENKGQVFIYDSLEINQVDAAMDANFNRIEHMMFIRVRHPAPTPDTPVYLEDDGCD